MTWVIGLKFFHYLSLFLAGGLGVANAMLVKAHQKAEMPPAPPVQKTMMKLARLGLLALVILWLTGIGLTKQIYGSFDLGLAFHLKLLDTYLKVFVVHTNEQSLHHDQKNYMPDPLLYEAHHILTHNSSVLTDHHMEIDQISLYI